MAAKQKGKSSRVGIEGLRDLITERKQEIRGRFKLYHEELYEAESMLLSDLNGILSRGEAEKRDIARQAKEVETAKDFMLKQLESSTNESLTNSVANLNKETQRLKRNEDEVPVISLSWKFDNFLHLIHQLCYIKEKSFPEKRTIAWSKMAQGDQKSNLGYDICYSDSEKRYYFINHYEGGTTNNTILVYDSQFKYLTVYTLDNPLPKCCIKTSNDFKFISSPNQIMKLKPSSRGLDISKVLQVELNASSCKMDLYGAFIYAVSNRDIVYKISVSDLQITEEITLRNEKDRNIKFAGIFDLKVTEKEIFVLFNSSVKRAIHCFDTSGNFIREVIGNNRGLQNPLSFCFDENNTVYVADGQVKAFDKFGKPLNSFGKEVPDNTNWARCVAFDSIYETILVLAELDGKYLHAYRQPTGQTELP